MDELLLDLKSHDNWNGILLVELESSNLMDDYQFEQALRLLPLRTQAKIWSKKTIRGRLASLANSLLEIVGCSVASNIPVDKLRIQFGAYGKPRLENKQGISFSMSNGQRYVVQYLSRRGNSLSEVGIDIASKEDYVDGEDIEMLRDIFSSSEYDHLKSISQEVEQKSLFAYYWSLKECYTKLTGVGLNCDLSRINFGEIELLTTPAVLERTIENFPVIFYSQWIGPDRNEVVTVCFHPNPNRVLHNCLPKLYRISLDELTQYAA